MPKRVFSILCPNDVVSRKRQLFVHFLMLEIGASLAYWAHHRACSAETALVRKEFVCAVDDRMALLKQSFSALTSGATTFKMIVVS
jgi:hypothetical protein